MRLLSRYLLTLIIAALGVVAGLVLLTRPAKAIASAGQSEEVPAALELNELSQRSVVYDRNGGVLAVLHAEENRSPVTLADVPPHVVQAILDVEDDGFYEHNGVNVRAIMRAALSNVEAGSIRQGGSTITQQLVKQSLLTPERDLGRKAKEAVLALRLERQMSKDEILQQYLNTVYLGNGAYGVQAAAEIYWGKQAKDLTVEEGAFLAGVIRNPVGYDPLRDLDDAAKAERIALTTARRDFALDRMVVRGHLDPAEAEQRKAVPIPSSRFEPLKTRDEYFLEEVKQTLLDDPRLGGTPSERYNAIFKGGLRIETTFDPRLQQIADDKVKQKVPDTKGQFVPALVSLEPGSGAVRAMVAGNGFEGAKYNLATGRGGGGGRQPGSSFKPIVLAAVLEKGIGPDSPINGTEPCPVRLPGQVPPVYEPGNYEGSKGSYGSIAAATARSYNCAYVRLGLALDGDPGKSLATVAEMARRLGLPVDEEYGPSISLGAEEATPLEMASVYATFANDGVRHAPYFVEQVLDRNGNVVLTGKKEGERVLDPNVARSVTYVLRQVVDNGTGTKARQRDRVVAGKTGTSQEWRDAWFVGYTGELATAVWLGSPEGQVSMRNVGGIRVTGGSYPAAVWGAFMAEAMQGVPPSRFVDPELSKFGRSGVRLGKDLGGSGGKGTTTTLRKKRPGSTTRATTPPPRARPRPRSGPAATTPPPPADEPSTSPSDESPPVGDPSASTDG